MRIYALPPVARRILETVARDPDTLDDLADEFKLKKIHDLDDPVPFIMPAVAKQLNAALLAAADSAKFERELDERYGPWKHVVLHPTMQKVLATLARAWQRTHLLGRRPMSVTNAVTFWFFMQRSRRVSAPILAISACILAGLNPLVVFLAIALWKALGSSRRYIPRGYRHRKPTDRFEPPEDSEYFIAMREGREGNRLSDPYTPAKALGTAASSRQQQGDGDVREAGAAAAAAAASDGGGGGASYTLRNRKEQLSAAAAAHATNGSSAASGESASDQQEAVYDHVVIGSELNALYAAALLSMCGHRVLVLEKGPLIGGDTVLELPAAGARGRNSAESGSGKESAVWRFETKPVAIARPRYVQMLLQASSSDQWTEPPKWNYVGSFGDGGSGSGGSGAESSAEMGGDVAGEDVGEGASSGGGGSSAAGGLDQEAVPQSGAKVYRVAECGKRWAAAFPTGVHELCLALCLELPDARTQICRFVTQINGALKDVSTFFLVRTLRQRSAKFLSSVLGVRPFAPAALPCRDVFRQITDGHLLALFSTMFGGENIPLERLAFGSFVLHAGPRIASGLLQPHSGWRGVASGLLATIEASGGRALTKAPVKHVLVEGGQATGVVMDDSKGGEGTVIRVRRGGSVISAVPVIETFERLLTRKDFLDGGGWPAGFSELEEARPRVNLCVGLRGNWFTELDAPQCDFEHVRDPAEAPLDETEGRPESEWYRISFTEPHIRERWLGKSTCCVVTAELPSHMLKRLPSKGGSGSGSNSNSNIAKIDDDEAESAPSAWYPNPDARQPRERLKSHLLRRLHEKFPFVEGRDEFVQLVDASRAHLSNTPARFGDAAFAGLRSPTAIPGLFLASTDLTVETGDGQVQAGWMAAHAVLGYDIVDFIWRRRTLVTDLETAEARKRRWWRLW